MTGLLWARVSGATVRPKSRSGVVVPWKSLLCWGGVYLHLFHSHWLQWNSSLARHQPVRVFPLFVCLSGRVSVTNLSKNGWVYFNENYMRISLGIISKTDWIMAIYDKWLISPPVFWGQVMNASCASLYLTVSRYQDCPATVQWNLIKIDWIIATTLKSTP